MKEPSVEPIATARVDELREALYAVIKDGGLPVRSEHAADILLNLRSVYARAVLPREPASRLAALNELLPRLIASLSDADWREATQVLFALAPGTRRSSLMTRRRGAASVLGYTEGHFRDAIEEQVLDAVAVTIQTDLMRYQSRVKRAVESLEPTGDTPRLGPEHLTQEEELVSRIWSAVYALRAELIAAGRLSEVEGHEAQVEDHRQAAAVAEQRLRALIDEYVATYDKLFVAHGDVEVAIAALSRLGDWKL